MSVDLEELHLLSSVLLGAGRGGWAGKQRIQQKSLLMAPVTMTPRETGRRGHNGGHLSSGCPYGPPLKPNLGQERQDQPQSSATDCYLLHIYPEKQTYLPCMLWTKQFVLFLFGVLRHVWLSVLRTACCMLAGPGSCLGDTKTTVS